ncbi:MAG: restriction endonuclease subunit S [Ornithinimicrobium sp.]
MNEWQEVVLGDLCERVTVGHVGKMATQYVERGVPFLRSQNVHPFVINRKGLLFIGDDFNAKLRKSSLAAGDVVVIRTGYPGTASVIPEDLDGANCADLVIITPSDRLNPHVLAGLFNSAYGQSTVKSQLVGSAQQHFNVGSAKAMKVRLPDRAGQDRIAEILCSLNDLIENNRRRVEILEEMARAIYREWFVEFRYPGHVDVPVVDSTLGPVPEGWEASTLGDVTDVTSGQSPKSEFYNEDGIGKPFHQGVADFGPHFPRTRKWCSIEGRSAFDGDVLISVRAPVGRINVADSDITIGRGLAAVRAKGGKQALLLGQLREVFAEEDSMGNDGAIFKSLSKAEFSSLPALVPPDDLANAAEEVLSDNLAMIRALSHATRQLSDLRDLLLPKLVTGQIDVSALDLGALLEGAVA